VNMKYLLRITAYIKLISNNAYLWIRSKTVNQILLKSESELKTAISGENKVVGTKTQHILQNYINEVVRDTKEFSTDDISTFYSSGVGKKLVEETVTKKRNKKYRTHNFNIIDNIENIGYEYQREMENFIEKRNGK